MEASISVRTAIPDPLSLAILYSLIPSTLYHPRPLACFFYIYNYLLFCRFCTYFNQRSVGAARAGNIVAEIGAASIVVSSKTRESKTRETFDRNSKREKDRPRSCGQRSTRRSPSRKENAKRERGRERTADSERDAIQYGVMPSSTSRKSLEGGLTVYTSTLLVDCV